MPYIRLKEKGGYMIYIGLMNGRDCCIEQVYTSTRHHRLQTSLIQVVNKNEFRLW